MATAGLIEWRPGLPERISVSLASLGEPREHFSTYLGRLPSSSATLLLLDSRRLRAFFKDLLGGKYSQFSTASRTIVIHTINERYCIHIICAAMDLNHLPWTSRGPQRLLTFRPGTLKWGHAPRKTFRKLRMLRRIRFYHTLFFPLLRTVCSGQRLPATTNHVPFLQTMLRGVRP